MLFNSHIYIFLFLPAVFACYFILQKKHDRPPIAFLVIASYFFYAYWNPKFLPLIILSTCFNYFLGKYLSENRNKFVLISGIAVNLAPLLFFKYSNFIIENINLAFQNKWPPFDLILPLAISFFTFQQIAYLVDSYQKITREHKIAPYALFVSFFPQLIAGPIVHHKEMLPQFFSKRQMGFNFDNLRDGTVLLSIGLFKKTVIADSFIKVVSNSFDQGHQLDFFAAWIGTLSYTFQLYFDFSGYCDIAMGSALFFNIVIPDNFLSPYQSTNIQMFWRRWHITLGRWLKNYLYIPLGGNRGSPLKIYRNLLLTFVIGGIWHGAGWNFLIWGFLHGMGIITFSIYSRFRIKLPKVLSITLTFLYVHFAWVFFRAADFQAAKGITTSLLGLNGFILPKNKEWLMTIRPTQPLAAILTLLAMAAIISFLAPNTKEILPWIREKRYAPAMASLIFALGILCLSKESEFLYFQF